MDIVKQVDSALAKLPPKDGRVNGLTYDGACYWYDTVQADSWPEKLYNASEDFKYVSPYIENTGNSPYLAFLQGNRKSHRHWWLRHRFDLIDAEWVSGEYADFYIGCYIPTNGETNKPIYKFKPASDFYFGFMTNTDIRKSGIFVKANEYYTFITESALNVGDPIKILGPYQIEELDFSVANGALGGNMINLDGDGKAGQYIDTRGTKLKKLIIGHKEYQTYVAQISSLTLVNQLQWLDISNCTGLIQNPDITQLNNLHIFEANGAKITAFYPCEGTNLYHVTLPQNGADNEGNWVGTKDGDYSPITNITLKDVTFNFNLNFDYKENITPGFNYEPDINLQEINFKNVQGIDTMQFVTNWYNAILESGKSFNTYTLVLEGINWTNAQPQLLLNLKKAGFKSLIIKGYILFQRMSYNEYAEIIKEENYGPNVFNTSGELVFDAPDAQYLFTDIAGQKETVYVKSGSTIKFSTVIFPLSDSNVVEYNLFTNKAIGNDYYHAGTDPNGLDGYYLYNNYKLYNKTGVLEIAETEETTSIKVLTKLNGSLAGAKTISIIASGVTIPQITKLQEINGVSLSGTVTFEVLNKIDCKVVLEEGQNSLRPTDTFVDDVRFEIYNGENLLNPDNYEYGTVTTDLLKCYTTSYDEFTEILIKDLSKQDQVDSREYFIKRNTLDTFVNEDNEEEIIPAYILVENKAELDLTGETQYYILKNNEYVAVETKDINPNDKYYYFTAKYELAEGEEYYELVTDKSTVVLTGDVTYYKLNHVVIGHVERNNVPEENTLLRVVFKPVFRTTIEENRMSKSLTVNINLISVIPSTYKFEILKTLNADYNFGISTSTLFSQGKTVQSCTLNSGDDIIKQTTQKNISEYDAIIIVDSIQNKNVTGLKFRKAGTYHVSFIGYTSNGIASNVGISNNITKQIYPDYDMQFTNINSDGFDIVVNPHLDSETGKETTNVSQNDTELEIFSTGIVGQQEGLYCELTQSFINNVATNDKLILGLYITYPTILEISGDDTIGVSYEQNKSVQHNFTVSTKYLNAAGTEEITTTEITKFYSITTRFVLDETNSDETLRNNIHFVGENNTSNNKIGYKFTIDGSDKTGSVFGKVIVNLYIDNNTTTPYLTVERNLKFEFTYASATTAQELIDAYDSTSDRKYYLMDENRSFYLISKNANDELVSGGWELAKQQGRVLVGIATVFTTNVSGTTKYWPVCIGMNDYPAGNGALLGVSQLVENIEYINADGSYKTLNSDNSEIGHLMTYGWYGWEKKQLYRTRGYVNTNANNGSTLFNDIIGLYSEYDNVKGRAYIPDGGEMYNIIANFTDINNIIGKFSEEANKLKSGLNSDYYRYHSVFRYKNLSPERTYILKHSNNASGYYTTLLNINNNYSFVRPFIRIGEI
jgi:hypothetical protein